MILEYLLSGLVGGITIDILLGDPPNKYHPVAWLGKLIEFFIPRLKDSGNSSAKKEKLKGTIFATCLIVIFGLGIHFTVVTTLHLLGGLAMIIISTAILKVTIAIRGMEKHIDEIVYDLEANNLKNARYRLSMIVRRDTNKLDEQHIISGMIECIGESTVDGIISSLFYYTFFGPAGTFVYRVINTLDSMIGYKDNYHKNIGWMSAKLDTVANYIPARIAAILIVISAKMIGADWKGSLHILERDHDKTFSNNAGYPMATIAGALRIRLEKIGQYSLGDGWEPASIEKCRIAISIMKLTTILFCIFLSTPLIVILYFISWWEILFGI
jgi:adenosylcobinamide-phosphate synthase